MKGPPRYGPEWIERHRKRLHRALQRAIFSAFKQRKKVPRVEEDVSDIEAVVARVLEHAAKIGWI